MKVMEDCRVLVVFALSFEVVNSWFCYLRVQFDVRDVQKDFGVSGDIGFKVYHL